MSEKNNVKWLSATIIGLAVTGVAAFAGYRAYKQMNDLDLDNIFDDLNETFLSGLEKEK